MPGFSLSDDESRSVTAVDGPKPRRASNGKRAKLPDLKYGGALTEALGQALASATKKQTKEERARSLVGDVIVPLEVNPGAKLSMVLPLLKNLDPENDGASFRRALTAALREVETSHPVVTLALKKRATPPETAADSTAPKSRPAQIASEAIGDEERSATARSTPTEEQLRELRAPASEGDTSHNHLNTIRGFETRSKGIPIVTKSFRRRTDKPGLVGAGPKSGGIAKTESILQASTIAILAGLKVGFIDADPTTGPTSLILGPKQFPLLKMTDDPKFVARAVDTFAGCDLVFIDFGAAQLSNPETILPTLQLMEAFGGFENCALMLNQIPHKTGLMPDIERIAGFFASRVQIRIARHDVNGSGKFEALAPALAQLPLHYVGRLHPALNDFWRSSGMLPCDLIRNPPAGFSMAVGAIAQHLLDTAHSGGFAEWLGATAAVPELAVIAQKFLRYIPSLPPQKLTDDAILSFNHAKQALAEVLRAESDAELIKFGRQAQHFAKEHNRVIA